MQSNIAQVLEIEMRRPFSVRILNRKLLSKTAEKMMTKFKNLLRSLLLDLKSIIGRIFGACLSNRRVANVIYSLAARNVLRDKAIRDLRPSVIYSKEGVKNSAFLMDTCVDAVKQAWLTSLDSGKKPG